MINIKMQPKTAQKLSPKIIVIGVGGAGGNAVNNMISSNLEGCEFLVCNTDAQALENTLCPPERQIQLGAHVTGGLGAGSKPEIGKAAAEESLEDVLKHVEGANMAFVTCGMGGGTGTGAAPVIARACRERGILTVGVVTKPFHFEGTHRMRMADNGIEEMQQYVDTLIVIPNQNLFRVANEKVGFAEAFRMVDGVLQSGVRGVTDLMVRPGLINLDFADIRTGMMEMGKAMMGTGEGQGDKRAVQAAEAAINNPLLDDISMKGAHGVIINVTGGYDMTLFEVDEACNRIRDEVDPDANIIFGATFDESLEGVMRVSIVATGIEKEAMQKTRGGSGTNKINAVGKAGLERARPQTESQQQQQPVTTSRTYPPAAQLNAPPAYSAAGNIRGITAPPVAAPGIAPVVAYAREQEALASTAPSVDPELDIYEQREFAVAMEPQQALSVPQNTALHGERYKGAFIPPKPVEGGIDPAASLMSPQAYTPPSPQSYAQTTTSRGGIQLNPPKLPNPDRKRTPSLFERITGTVQQHLEGIREEVAPRERAAPPRSQPSMGGGVPQGPSQGRLNIDTPAARPRAQADEELDIPAFLRRQAN
ncbi:MAG: cell division protein FtsZ [Alphaproteobacteria bacterium]|jgi:cell division protein FtsZ|nr:cell division protein FtsZ [Alphaproteobacteria bacterium]